MSTAGVGGTRDSSWVDGATDPYNFFTHGSILIPKIFKNINIIFRR